MPESSWREYERGTAALFEEAGLCASVGASIDGVRARHRVDVLVSNQPRIGSHYHWIVECKDQIRPVTKAVVLTLRNVVDDVGAQRGFVVSEAGFQPGAAAADAKTNITLCDLTSLRMDLREARVLFQLSELEARVGALCARLDALFGKTIYPPSHAHTALYAGSLNWKQWIHWRACFDATMAGLIRARGETWPTTAALGPPPDSLSIGEPRLVDDADQFVEVATERCDAGEAWLTAAQQWVLIDFNAVDARDAARTLLPDLLGDFPNPHLDEKSESPPRERR